MKKTCRMCGGMEPMSCYWVEADLCSDCAGEIADAHSCAANNDGTGCCDICGALIPGTAAYYSEHGFDPPENDCDY